ncbi:MAG: CCA tRNA nucleotidyltransferase [Mariprofundaceae bacterium]
MTAPFKVDLDPVILDICRKLQQADGTAYLVGGCVRDMALGLIPKDFDIEVYGLDIESLQNALSELGRCEQVGRSFGVIKLWSHGHEIDIALPRKERKAGAGHRGFDVQLDPHLDPEEASSRRDFTINAMMFDPCEGVLLDFHGGMADLESHMLRHISPAFVEDPLRVLRAMQFASRFKLQLDAQTALLCQALKQEADTLAIERVWVEWRKWAEGEYPSYGLKVLEESGWIELYPELAALIDCPQEPKWHPEGDVWTHTCLVVDGSARIASQYGWKSERRWQLLFAALAHDMGKPVTTHTDEKGRIRSTEHSLKGIGPALDFMQRIGAPASLIQYLPPLVKEHLTHMHGEPTERAVRRLSARLEPADIEMWEALVEADASGRSPIPPSRPALPWLEKAQAMQHHQGKPKAIVTGDMLMKLGVKPGPQMGAIIAAAYEAQLDGKIHDAESAISWCKKFMDELQ